MIDTLTSTPFFGLGVTLLCWYLAVRFQKRTGLLICNPVLVASLLVIGIMLLFHIPLDNYNAGGSIIKLLLAPPPPPPQPDVIYQLPPAPRPRRSGSEHLPAAGHSEAELLAGGAGLLCG